MESVPTLNPTALSAPQLQLLLVSPAYRRILSHCTSWQACDADTGARLTDPRQNFRLELQTRLHDDTATTLITALILFP